MPTKARPKSMLSFTHRKSSSSSHVKVGDLTETTEEKASHRVTSKADPTKAINEAQPSRYSQAYDGCSRRIVVNKEMQLLRRWSDLLSNLSEPFSTGTATATS